MNDLSLGVPFAGPSCLQASDNPPDEFVFIETEK